MKPNTKFPSGLRRLLRAASLVGLTLCALVAVVDPAAAASGDVNVKTTDTDPGGTGRWRPPGDAGQACDTQKDAYNVYTKIVLQKVGGGDEWSAGVTDFTADGKCANVPFDFPENRRVKVRVCLKHYKTGALKFCSAWKYGNTT